MRVRNGRLGRATPCLVACLVPIMAAVGAAPAHAAVVRNGPARGLSSTVGVTPNSTWAGYVAQSGQNSEFGAAGEWRVPTITCTSANSRVEDWVGTDGYNDSTVEQVGTTAACVNGKPTYSAWWEMFPYVPVSLGSVHAGDYVEGEINVVQCPAHCGQHWLALDVGPLVGAGNPEVSFGQFENSPPGYTPLNRSGECISETQPGIRVANFGTVTFTYCTMFADSNYSRFLDVTQPPSGWAVYRLNLERGVLILRHTDVATGAPYTTPRSDPFHAFDMTFKHS